MKTKLCGMCGKILSVKCYDPKVKGGKSLQCYCRECRLIEQRQYRKTKAGKERDLRYERSDKKMAVLHRYRNSEKGKRTLHKNMAAYYQRHKEMRGVRNTMNYALRTGKITRPDHCSKCGSSTEIHAHHTDYTKPLLVTWFCSACHKAAHNKKHLRCRR
jgi:hypothetical protein